MSGFRFNHLTQTMISDRIQDFQAALKQVSVAIEEASFLTIDGEFTGLNHPGLSHTCMFDTPEERYHKILQGSSDFLLIQFGLCAFSYDGNKKRYTAKPFNFYIFPRPHSRSSPDLRFSCQSSSLEFLAAQGFDFNKMIREGIPYLTPVHEGKLREATMKKHEAFSSPSFISPGGVASDPGINKGPVIIPPEQQEFIDNVCVQVEKFVEKSEEELLSLAPCSAFQRKLTYQAVNAKYVRRTDKTKTSDKKERYIVVTRVKGEDAMKKLEEERHAAELAEIEAAVGFTHVVKKISQSGKLVVGHNMFLDIIHTIHQFLYPLPHDYLEFKSMCHCVFPRLLDTKLMANTQPFKDRIYNSGLEALTKITEMEPFSKPEVVIAEKFTECGYDTKECAHEAGYDAFLTGRCFIALSNFLAKCQEPPSDRVPSSSPLLEPFVNKIFLMRPFDIPYMDLAGPDLSPPREHVFHLSFPEDWRVPDINNLFSAFGNVQIGWIDDISAFVALYNRSNADQVLKSLCKKGAPYRIMSYEAYKQQLQWNTKMVYRRTYSNEKATPGHEGVQVGRHERQSSQEQRRVSNHTMSTVEPSMAGKHERQGSEEEKKVSDVTPGKKSDVTPGKLKRPLSQENGEPQTKKLKVSDEVVTDSDVEVTKEQEVKVTPESTPEKIEDLKVPKKMTYAEITKSGEKKNKNKMFAEPQDW